MALRPIFFDTETTGMRPENARLVELAAFDPQMGCTFERLINPGRPIPAEATNIHKISDSMVANAPSFKEVGQEFIAFCSGDVALIGHNSDAFDLPFLRAEFTRNGMTLPNWCFIDSLKWARRYRRDLPRHALQFLRQIYGIQENQAHRALNDVMVLTEVFQAMTDDLSCEQIATLLGPSTSIKTEIPEPKKPKEALSLFK